MSDRWRTIIGALLLASLLVLPATTGWPQETTTLTPTARLDTDKLALDGIEAALTRTNLTDAGLQQLRTDIDPVQLDLQSVLTELQPRVDAAKARLAQLGPKPDPKVAAAPEASDITAERSAQEKLFTDLDAVAKRARVLLVQATQLDTTVGSLRRGLFTRSVLAQTYSLLDPRLWGPVLAELPSDGRAIAFLWNDWWNAVISKLPQWQLAAIVATLVLIVLLYEPAQRIARRVAGRDETGTAPTRLRKVLAALWVTLLTFAVPAASLAVTGFMLNGFDVITPRLQPLTATFTRSALILAVIVGLARGFLAPRRPAWRIPPLSEEAAERLYRATLVIGGLVAATRVVDALNDTISVGLPTAVASRGLLTAVAGATMALTLDRLGVTAEEGRKPAAPRQGQARDWSGAVRLGFWGLSAIVGGALLIGFIAFAAFLVLQIAFVSAILVALVLLLGLVDEGVTALLDPARGLGRMLLHTLGLRRSALDILGILLAAMARVVLVAVALLLALAPWRIESGDMLSTVQAAFFGFAIGDLVISPSSIAVAVILFLVALGVTHAVQRWLEGTLLPRTRLDAGLQNSIKTSLGYVGVMVACALGMSQLGVSFERLAIVAGALSVGIGFGLQSIVNNFVSGLILLWERAIRVGDWIVVGDEQGYVRRINVRSTEIETFDRATVIVPNSNMVSGVVKNWLRNDRVGRIRLPFTVGFDADPEKVRTILIEEAKANEHVLSIPSPQVLLAALGEANMRLELVCYLEDVETTQRTTSDLLFAILGRLRGIGLMNPPGPPTLGSPVLDKLDAWLSAKVAETGNGVARR